MTARARVPAARESLRSSLGREPTVTEVAAIVGVSRERVRQIYVEFGWDPRKGVDGLHAPGRAKREAREQRAAKNRAERRRLHGEIVAYARANPKVTQAEIGRMFAVSQRHVSDVCLIAGVVRRHMFSVEEDEVLANEDLSDAQAAKLLNRAFNVVRLRRKAIAAGRRPWTDDPESDETVMKLFDELGTCRAVAERLDICVYRVGKIVKRSRGVASVREAKGMREAPRRSPGMAKLQTRRSVSLKGLTHQRLKDYCKANGYSVSGYLERIIAEKLDAANVPVETVLRAEPYPTRRDPERETKKHFTF